MVAEQIIALKGEIEVLETGIQVRELENRQDKDKIRKLNKAIQALEQCQD